MAEMRPESLKQQQLRLATALRMADKTWVEVAEALRVRFRLNHAPRCGWRGAGARLKRRRSGISGGQTSPRLSKDGDVAGVRRQRRPCHRLSWWIGSEFT